MTIGAIAFTRKGATGTATIEFIQGTTVLKTSEVAISVLEEGVYPGYRMPIPSEAEMAWIKVDCDLGTQGAILWSSPFNPLFLEIKIDAIGSFVVYSHLHGFSNSILRRTEYSLLE